MELFFWLMERSGAKKARHALKLPRDFSLSLLFQVFSLLMSLKESTTDGCWQTNTNLKPKAIGINEISWCLDSLRMLHCFLFLFLFLQSFYNFNPMNHLLN